VVKGIWSPLVNWARMIVDKMFIGRKRINIIPFGEKKLEKISKWNEVERSGKKRDRREEMKVKKLQVLLKF